MVYYQIHELGRGLYAVKHSHAYHRHKNNVGVYISTSNHMPMFIIVIIGAISVIEIS